MCVAMGPWVGSGPYSTDQLSYRLELLFLVLGLFAVLIYWARIGHVIFLLGIIGLLLFIFLTGCQFPTFCLLVVYVYHTLCTFRPDPHFRFKCGVPIFIIFCCLYVL
jgi:hypothetical protein